MKILSLILAATVVRVVALPAQDRPRAPRALVMRAVETMGGDSVLRSIASTSADFYQALFSLGQEEWLEGPTPATLAIGTFTNDLEGRRQAQQVEQRLTASRVTRQRRVVLPNMGMVENNNAQTVIGADALGTVHRQMRLVPERLLLGALEEGSRLTPVTGRRWRGRTADGVRYVGAQDTLTLWFDRTSGRLLAHETLADDPILGDRRTVVTFGQYRAVRVGDRRAMLPHLTETSVNGRVNAVITYGTIRANVALADSLFAIPDSIVRRTPAASVVAVTLTELAPGVYHATGGSHHSLVVVQGDSVTVFEAPQGRPRMRAVLDTIASRFPKARLRLVINTHHHWDHAGGVRTALAAGVPVLTHANNVDWVRSVGAERKTVSPDNADGRATARLVRGVRDSVVVGRGAQQLIVYHMPHSHAEGMLIGYVPAAKILFVADAAPSPLTYSQAEVVEFVKARGLAVERLAGAHLTVQQWSDVERSTVAAR